MTFIILVKGLFKFKYIVENSFFLYCFRAKFKLCKLLLSFFFLPVDMLNGLYAPAQLWQSSWHTVTSLSKSVAHFETRSHWLLMKFWIIHAQNSETEA